MSNLNLFLSKREKMSDTKSGGSGSFEEPNMVPNRHVSNENDMSDASELPIGVLAAVPSLDASNENVMCDASESTSEIFVEDVLKQLDRDEANAKVNDIEHEINATDEMDLSGDAVLSANGETFSDGNIVNSTEISVLSEVGLKTIRKNRFYRSQFGKRKNWKAPRVWQSKPSGEIGGPERKLRSKKLNRQVNDEKPEKFHIMQNYRQVTDEKPKRHNIQAVNEYVIDMVMQLKMDQQILAQKLTQLKGDYAVCSK